MRSYPIAEEFFNPNQFEKNTISVIGCGRIGILQACLFADAGFKVLCTDIDPFMAVSLSKGKVPFLRNELAPIISKLIDNGKLSITNNLEEAVSRSRSIVITAPVSVDERGRADYTLIERTLRRISSHLRRGTLIIISSVLGIGITRSLKELIEQVSGMKAGLDFFIAYSPIPFPDEQNLETIKRQKRLVAADDKNSLDSAISLLEAISKGGLFAIDNLMVAEAAVLFNIVCKHVGAALAEEFSLFCEEAGLDYSFIRPFISLSQEYLKPTLPIDDRLVFILLEEAENLNIKLKVIPASLAVNNTSLKHFVKLVVDALKKCGKTLRRAKIAILGGSRTPNSIDTPKPIFDKLISMLAAKGAKIKVYDPFLSVKVAVNIPNITVEKSLNKAIEGADCLIILTGHESLRRLNLDKVKLIAKMPAAIVDLEGIIDPHKAEAAGFVYRKLGRGVSKT
ncbi:MAG: nucleotide sugar dehydrogenase [Candidatus Bathyarchaeia archaeon]